ncbi:MAG: sugar transferase [Flavobacteriales bacterium]|jgi:lipopolysaccharide/colanic/teichoic acid biosynthesis glycosyltransferase|nr:sugar transferase [Flavobacteriales bacterium]MDG2058795.1 sugar transferase [Flavobacteriales bacterium]
MIKRIFDFSSSLLGLVILFPLLILISFAIKIGSSGPILFSQKRVGKDGKQFILIKFRSMMINQESNNTATAKGDDRITTIGVFLRKYKLDELPELWNVLKGEMSLVGPRPDVPGYADNLKGEDRKILKLRPGITGTASLKYVNEEEILSAQDDPQKYNDEVIFPDKVKVNLEYYKNQSLWLDIKIIFATIFRTSY